MPLHLLGKKSWNVYNQDNIARVKKDEAEAKARREADEQRIQDLEAERRAAILRGETPPPLPEQDEQEPTKTKRRIDGRDRDPERTKKRRLKGEDDTDRDIRVARDMVAPRNDDEDSVKTIKMRSKASDAPLLDQTGHIDLFPIDKKTAEKSRRHVESEKERKKEPHSEDQYTMRFENAAGKGGLEKPWYAGNNVHAKPKEKKDDELSFEYSSIASKDIWGNEDPRRKEREAARISSSDPLTSMQMAQKQLKQSQQDKRKWIDDRDKEFQKLESSRHSSDRRKGRVEVKRDGITAAAPHIVIEGVVVVGTKNKAKAEFEVHITARADREILLDH